MKYLTTFKLSFQTFTSEGFGLIYSLTEVISYHSNSGADSQGGVFRVLIAYISPEESLIVTTVYTDSAKNLTGNTNPGKYFFFSSLITLYIID